MAEPRATDLDEKETTFDKCDPNCASGPVREGGGTTGAGNLSPGGANRTGGATSGVSEADPARARDLPPDA
jgi:hypothetical protein